MNDKIRELAEQSGFFPMPESTEGDWEFRAENARYEKFAESIIKECVESNEIIAYSFSQGNIFGNIGDHNGTALFESVTRPFGDGARHFDPIGIAEYFNKRITEKFGIGE